jgi:hypothetical protein
VYVKGEELGEGKGRTPCSTLVAGCMGRVRRVGRREGKDGHSL